MIFKDFIAKLEKIKNDEKDIIYKDILDCLIRNYKEISKNVEIIDFEIRKKSHYLELSVDKSFFFEINATQRHLHLIINKFEEMFFFENDSFRDFHKNILNALFEGSYTIIEYKNDKTKSVLLELKFTDIELNLYNQKNNIVPLNKIDILNTTEGIRLVS